jgi:beta-phosphoglucomutase-like phosphatase (HAD superfamily)
MRRVIVDVDGTLVDFHTPLHRELRKRFPDVPKGLPKEWNWFGPYMTTEQFYAACHVVHERQMRGHKPMKGAFELFKMLNSFDTEIIVASHRRQDMAPQMAQWLNRHHLTPYAGVYAGNNKHPLIEQGCIIIDDAPHTIEYAKSVGATPVWMDWPWNEGGYKDLEDITHAVYAMLK